MDRARRCCILVEYRGVVIDIENANYRAVDYNTCSIGEDYVMPV